MAAVMSPLRPVGLPMKADFTAVLSEPAHAEQMDQQTEAASSSVKVSQKAPSRRDLDAVANFLVLTSKHDSVPFRTLYQPEGEGDRRRVLLLFVRHFFCGNCQEYIRTLSTTITPESLLELPVPTEIVIIGCGNPDLIPFYKAATSCAFPIYADPTRELYLHLGMARTMAPGDKPEYVRKSLFGIVASGLTQGMTAGRNMLKGGDFWQVGGEFLFEDGEARRCHRMSTTRDHTEMGQLKVWLGLKGKDQDSEKEKSKSKRMSWVADMGAGVRKSMSLRRSSGMKRWSSTVSTSSQSSAEKNKRMSMADVKK